MKKRVICIVTALVLALMCGCGVSDAPQGKATNEPTAAAEATKAPTAEPTAEIKNVVNAQIEMADGGVIKLELYPDIAPVTVENFKKLANEGFYNGLIFHRVINGFMIQGGGFNAAGKQQMADTIKGEFANNGVENTISHERGVISMARTSLSMDSASSQFFICHANAKHLDRDYAAFGRVTDGLEVVDKIASVKTDESDKPIENQVIKSITIL